jgi:hypothetical protein
MILHQMLVKVLDRDALVALAIERLHLLGAVARNAPDIARRPRTASVPPLVGN